MFCIDFALAIWYNTFKIFMKGELPNVNEIENEIPMEGNILETKVVDVYTEMIEM